MQNLNQFKNTLDTMTPVVLDDGAGEVRQKRVVQVTFTKHLTHYTKLLTELQNKYPNKYDDVTVKKMVDDMREGDIRQVRGHRISSRGGFNPDIMENWINTEGEIPEDDS